MNTSVSISPLVERLPFSNPEAHRAADAWGFNCGPAALAIIMRLTPEEIKPHLGDFRGYMNPTQMYAALRSLGADWRLVTDKDVNKDSYPRFGIARIQWGGPWMQPRVPIPARYSKTHWVASYREPGRKTQIYDINVHAWWSHSAWVRELVPRILADVPRADGSFWVTHAIEVTR